MPYALMAHTMLQ